MNSNTMQLTAHTITMATPTHICTHTFQVDMGLNAEEVMIEMVEDNA